MLTQRGRFIARVRHITWVSREGGEEEEAKEGRREERNGGRRKGRKEGREVWQWGKGESDYREA